MNHTSSEKWHVRVFVHRREFARISKTTGEANVNRVSKTHYQVVTGGPENPIFHRKADAYLVAAAPELLEFAKWYVGYVEQHDDDAKDGMPRYRAAKELIVKAVGG